MQRAITYSNFQYVDITKNHSAAGRLPPEYESSIKLHPTNAINQTNVIRIDEQEIIYPSKLGKFIPTNSGQRTQTEGGDSTQPNPPSAPKQRLVCYYASPAVLNRSHELYPEQIDPKLCTHINVGIVSIKNHTLVIDSTLSELFKQMSNLRRLNSDLKVLMWIGGPSDSLGFIQMIENHANRKEFIKSVKAALMTYRLDGIDLGKCKTANLNSFGLSLNSSSFCLLIFQIGSSQSPAIEDVYILHSFCMKFDANTNGNNAHTY